MLRQGMLMNLTVQVGYVSPTQPDDSGRGGTITFHFEDGFYSPMHSLRLEVSVLSMFRDSFAWETRRRRRLREAIQDSHWSAETAK
jgi:hypothetical protein